MRPLLRRTILICLMMLVCGCANNALRSQLAESQSRVEELETQVEELQSRVDTLESGISDIRASFDTLDDEISSLESESFQFDFEDWSYVVVDVQRAISSVRMAANDLDSAISAVEQGTRLFLRPRYPHQLPLRSLDLDGQSPPAAPAPPHPLELPP